ncbi:FAD-linked oxidoreductase-like protein [Sporodiniella umbellata]|nr:FAD-linked oxidoreductase-like protein [Sporodiniella umbellata]
MHRIFARAAVPHMRSLRVGLPPAVRSMTTGRVVQRVPFKSISASVALASSLYFYNQSVVTAEAMMANPMVTGSSPGATMAELQDKDNRIAVQAKSVDELALALFVYRLCAFPWLVDAAPYLISAAEKLHLQAPVYWFVKQTFFRHFCGGETSEECISSMDRLAHSGINCILDLSIEADLHLDETREPVQGQSKYFHEEKQADVILKMIKTCLRTASGGNGSNAMVAVKVTAFSPPELLLRLNQAITALDQAFLEQQENGRIDAQGLRQVVQSVLPPAATPAVANERQTILDRLARDKGSLDLLEFRKLFHLQGPGRHLWWATQNQANALLNSEDLEAYDRMMQRVDEACGLAKELNVSVMVDAEQSYFQNAIDHVAVEYQRKYNAREDGPTVFNTYQMYTKSARGRMELDEELSRRENFVFAAKLVRGAYMVSERKRAIDMGYASPIHDTLEDTHESYNGGVKYLLNKLRKYQETSDAPLSVQTSPIVFMVASHNRDSVLLTIEEMEKNHISPHAGVVMFGQLFAMQDQISYTLARHGYAIYKYLPYGMIDEVIPYLLRRAQENSSVLGGPGVVHERQLLWDELKRRITGNASADVSIKSST